MSVFLERDFEKCAYPVFTYTEKPAWCHVRHLKFTHFLLKMICNQCFRKLSLQVTKFQSTLRAFLHNNLTYEVTDTEWKKVHLLLFLSSYALLNVHFDIISVNNQLDSQFFFMYVYFYSLHVSGSHAPIIRRINYINMTSGICHSVQTTVLCAQQTVIHTEWHIADVV